MFQRWLAKIRPAAGKLNRTADNARSQRAVLAKLYEGAEKDGCNKKGFKDAIALMAKAADEVSLQQRTVGRILRIAEHPLVMTHGLFPDLPFAEKPPSPYHAGQRVGRAGGSIGDCPHKAGSEDFIEWRDGYESGQRTNRESLRQASAAPTPA